MKTMTHYDDGLLTECSARVVSCLEDKGEYLVTLDHTVFYVESGGQPSDTGWIDGQPVKDVYKCEGDIIHVLDRPVSGTVQVKVDEKRRLLNMQRQTCQHLVASIFYRKLGHFVPSAHVFEDGTCDLDVTCDQLTAEDLKFAEDLANQMILEDLPVHIEYIDAERAKAVCEDTFGDFRSYDGKIDKKGYRLIRLGDFDAELCGCVHCSRLGMIRGVTIIGTTKIKDGVTVTLSCGENLLERMAENEHLLSRVSADLGVKPEAIPEAIQVLREQNKAEMRKRELYRERHLAQILEQRRAWVIETPGVSLQVFDDDRDSLEDMKHLMVNLVKEPGVVCVALKEDGGKASIVISRSSDVDAFNAGAVFMKLKDAHGFRGGGSPVVAQGGGAAFEGWKQVVLTEIEKALQLQP